MNEFRYKKLLSPVQINDKVTLKTRMMSGHVPPLLGDGPMTYPDAGIRAHYRNIASNGCALLLFSLETFNFMYNQMLEVLRQQQPDLEYLPDDSDVAHMCFVKYDVNDPGVQNTLCRLAAEIHALGTHLMLDLDPVMPEGTTYGGGPYLNQSDLGNCKEQLPPAPKECFPEIIRGMVEKCKKFRTWGWDGVSISIMDYINRSMNIRTDEYGGPIENRARFIVELLTAIRKEMGPDFLIHIYLPGESRHGTENRAQEGFTFEDCVAFAKMVEGIVDILELRADNMTIQSCCGYNHKEGQSFTLDYCRRMKEAGVTNVLLSAVGANQDPEIMERALEDGYVDLFTISRAFFADPEYYNKMKEGRGEDIIPCLTCNKCQGIGRAPWLQTCAVNPKFGMNGEESRFVHEPRSLKKIAVVGGGPAGMRTAIMAAEKGHSVTLYEKTDYLGGQLSHADYYEFKWPLKRYRLWLIRQLGKSNVRIVMNHAPTADELAAEGYEAVFACTGASPMKPGIEGAADPMILNSHEVWGNEDRIGKHVVIVGGSEVGMEAAIYLAQHGREVLVVTRQDRLGHDCSILHNVTMTRIRENEDGYGEMVAEWEIMDNLQGVTDAVTTKVTQNSVTYVKDGQETTVTCDTVIVGGGMRPNKAEALQYAGVTPEFYLVGDVEGNCGNLQNLNRRAFVSVNLL